MNVVELSHFEIKSSFENRIFIVINKNDKKMYTAKIYNIHSNDKKEQDENYEIISQEMNILSKINHPSILKFLGLNRNDFDGNHFPTFIFEYAPHGNLNDILKQERSKNLPIEWDDTKKYLNLYGIAYGMSFLHQNNIIHGNLSPDNIMEDENFLPKICGIEISKFHDQNQTNDQNQFSKSLYYMAPEMFTEGNINKSVDVYAYSIILYEIVTSQEPYTEITNPDTLKTKIINNYRSEFPKGTQVSDHMIKLIRRCWNQDPSSRPTFQEIVKLLGTTKFVDNSGFNVDTDIFNKYQKCLEAATNTFDSKDESVHNAESSITQKQSSTIQQEDKETQQNDQNSNKKFDNDHIESNQTHIKISPIDAYNTLNQEIETSDDLINEVDSLLQNCELEDFSSNKVERIEHLGEMLLKGEGIQIDESKGVELLTKAALKFQSVKSKILLCKHLLKKENTDEPVNYYLAKRYAKEAAESGNVEAFVIYAKICEKNVNNKYGKVYQDFEEAFKYFKKAYEAGDPDGIAYYAFYLELPHGLFTPNPEESVRLTKIAADKGSAFGIHRDGVHHLNGIYRPVNFEEGWRLIDIAIQKDVPDSYFFYGLANYYGSYGKTKNQEVGLEYFKKAMEKGSLNAISRWAQINIDSLDYVDIRKSKMRLIENGFVFDSYQEDKYSDVEDISYNAAYNLDMQQYEKAVMLLKRGIGYNYLTCLKLLAEGYLLEFINKEKAKKIFKRASDFLDLNSVKDFVQYCEKEEFGSNDQEELDKYKKLLEVYEKFL